MIHKHLLCRVQCWQPSGQHWTCTWHLFNCYSMINSKCNTILQSIEDIFRFPIWYSPCSAKHCDFLLHCVASGCLNVEACLLLLVIACYYIEACLLLRPLDHLTVIPLWPIRVNAVTDFPNIIIRRGTHSLRSRSAKQGWKEAGVKLERLSGKCGFETGRIGWEVHWGLVADSWDNIGKRQLAIERGEIRGSGEEVE